MTKEEAIAAVQKHGGVVAAADALGMTRFALRRRMHGAGEPVANRPPVVTEKLDPVVEHKLRQENSRLRADLKDVLERKHANESYENFVASVVSARRPPPEWLVNPARKGKRKPAIASIAVSDGHYTEVVRPEEVEYANGYNCAIAKERTQRAFTSAVRLARDYTAGIEYQGIVVNLLGDNVSGTIHDELAETNEGTACEAVLDVSEQLALGIGHLAENFPTVHVVALPGNHSRLTEKSHAKGRSKKNLDWLIAHLVAREFKSNKRVTFQIGDGADARYTVFGVTYLATHGDQFKGGSGIAGLMSPLMLGDHRKRKRAQGVGNPYDVLVMGHWHQLTLGVSGIIINGSIKGYDEYAYTRNLPFEPPQQAFWITDPEHGITIRAPLQVLGDNEPWRVRVAA